MHTGSSWYDTAKICLNGHVLTTAVKYLKIVDDEYCSTCGKQAISSCPHCEDPIRGFRHEEGIDYFDKHFIPPATNSYYALPRFCHKCGRTYPWTETAVAAAKELARELEQLSKDDRDALEGSIDDLVAEGPRTEVALARFKRIIAKAGDEAKGGFKTILVDVVSEVVKKVLMP